MPRVPINPDVLRWAMADTGRTASELAEVSGRDAALVARWLTGDEQPFEGDLGAIANLLGRSPHFFLLPSPPAQRSYAASFRASPHARGRREASPDELAALKSAHRVQRVAKWALDGRGASVTFPDLQQSPNAYAALLSEWLNWDVRNQVTATSKTAAFKALRRAVEERGIIVLLRDVGETECRGFSLPDDEAPLLLINKGYRLASVRSYTLLHEIAHLSRGQEFLCRDDNADIERWCDRVAAAFLIPGLHLRKYVHETLQLERVSANNIDAVRRIANRYKTSWQAVTRRLRDLGLGDDALVNRYAGPGVEPPEAGFNPNVRRTTPDIRLDEYGAAYARVLLDAVEGRRLADLDARRYLNVDGSQLAGLATLVRQGV